MEPAYLLSFLVYLLVYFRLLRKNEVYLCEIGMKYKLLILIQGSIFQMFYNFVFIVAWSRFLCLSSLALAAFQNLLYLFKAFVPFQNPAVQILFVAGSAAHAFH